MLNPFFQQGNRQEQSLVQSLINEQLKMYGVEVHYLPRKYLTEKSIIREVVQSKFDDAYPLEAYLDTYDGYGENPVILSKFGIEQKNEITLTISKDRWETYIEPLMENEPNVKLITRPKAGDLIYFPLGDRLFEIKYVEHEKPFYQLRKTYIYELRCELFRYEDEVIDTGVEDIDDLLVGDESDGQTEDGISTIAGPTQTLTMVGTGVSVTAVTGLVDGGIQFITIGDRGGGYTDVPRVAISSAPSTGITGIASVRMIGGLQVCNLNVNAAAKSVQNADLNNAGAGYSVAPTITVADPSFGSSGNFVFNEIVTGSATTTTARVRTWNSVTNILEVATVGGEGFKIGETITGSKSGATQVIRVVDTQIGDDEEYADNFNIEAAADEILDFSEQNPFGVP